MPASVEMREPSSAIFFGRFMGSSCFQEFFLVHFPDTVARDFKIAGAAHSKEDTIHD
jgi:hypothetical protein